MSLDRRPALYLYRSFDEACEIRIESEEVSNQVPFEMDREYLRPLFAFVTSPSTDRGDDMAYISELADHQNKPVVMMLVRAGMVMRLVGEGLIRVQ